MKQQNAEYLTGVVLGLITFALSIILTGCSFKVEMGWHGRTGVDAEQFTEGAVKPVRK